MIPRLYVKSELSAATMVELTDEQAHYLRSVLRRAEGDDIRLFNARDGEFAASIKSISKKSVSALTAERLRAPEAPANIELLIAPVKRAAIELVIQKATELGVSAVAFVVTDRTNADRLRIERLQAIALEAAEQCGRLSVPEIRGPAKLAETLNRWDRARTLFFCDEAGDDPEAEWGGANGRADPLFKIALEAPAGSAAIVSLAIWQAACGDLRRP